MSAKKCGICFDGAFDDATKKLVPTLQRQNAENLKQIFPEKEYRASVPISTFMCLWANYIFPRLVCLFCWRKYLDWSWEYINRSKTHECGNWGWGRAIPRKGIYKRNGRCSADYTSRYNPCTHTPPAAWASVPTWLLPRPRTYILIIFAHKPPCRRRQVALRPL